MQVRSKDSDLIEVILDLDIDSMNAIFTDLPFIEEITTTVFGLRKESVPGTYGFGGVFFPDILEDNLNLFMQCYLEILQGWLDAPKFQC